MTTPAVLDDYLQDLLGDVGIAPAPVAEAPPAVAMGRTAVGLLGEGCGVGGGHEAIMPRYGQFVRGGRRGLPAERDGKRRPA